MKRTRCTKRNPRAHYENLFLPLSFYLIFITFLCLRFATIDRVWRFGGLSGLVNWFVSPVNSPNCVFGKRDSSSFSPSLSLPDPPAITAGESSSWFIVAVNKCNFRIFRVEKSFTNFWNKKKNRIKQPFKGDFDFIAHTPNFEILLFTQQPLIESGPAKKTFKVLLSLNFSVSQVSVVVFTSLYYRLCSAEELLLLLRNLTVWLLRSLAEEFGREIWSTCEEPACDNTIRRLSNKDVALGREDSLRITSWELEVEN